MDATSTAVEIFCSYAHADEAWRQKIETHLSLLKRQGLISFWHHRLITPGTDWAKAIDIHLETASIILLLVSADFLASDYCYGIEMKRAIARHETGEAQVIPILVRPVDWRGAPFAHLHAIPPGAKPLATWGDEDAALVDISVGLRRALEDHSLFVPSASPMALPSIWNIPYPHNPFFLGRETELAQIHQRLQSSRTTALSQPQALTGLGGIGKTQVAVEYAYHYHQNYTVVLWARGENADTLLSSYFEIASLLRLSTHTANKQDVIVQSVKTWLKTHRDWLLILDNVDTLMMLSDFLPPSVEGHLLLTTRATATGRLARQLEIKTLLPEHATLLLLRRATLLAPDADLAHALPHEREQAGAICQELGNLPLAIDQAGAYLEETGMDLASYQQIYQQHRIMILQERRGFVADHPLPVTMTWSLSFQRVKEYNPAAAALLRLCSFLGSDAIAEEILMAGFAFLEPVLDPVATDAFLFHRAIEALRAYSLIRRDLKEKTLSVHRLVQVVIQDTLEETEKRRCAEQVIRSMNAVFPDGSLGTWRQCERLLPQALVAVSVIEPYQFFREEAGCLLYKMASYLHARARYSEAERYYQHARRVFEQCSDPDHPRMVTLCNGVADLYYEQGRYIEAELLYQHTRRAIERHLGGNHPSVVPSLNGVADIFRQQGQDEEAEQLYQQALHINERSLGSEYLQIARSLTGLASVYRHQGKSVEAKTLYQRALHIREHYQGPTHLQVASPLHNLAIISRHRGQYAKAYVLYLRAFQIWEQYLGLEHPQVTYALTGLAIVYYEQGQYVEAEFLYLHVLRVFEQHLVSEHPQIAYALAGLADIYGKQGKYMEAELLYQRALHICEQVRGPSHPHTAAVLHDLAMLWDMQGKSKDARTGYTRALSIREQMLGVHHPQMRETRACIMALLYKLKKDERAMHFESKQTE